MTATRRGPRRASQLSYRPPNPAGREKKYPNNTKGLENKNVHN